MNIASSLIAVEYDAAEQQLFSTLNTRRVASSSCRDSLNGYQKALLLLLYADQSRKRG